VQTTANLEFTGLTQIWVNSKALIGMFSQTDGSTCEFWVNPVNFTLQVSYCDRTNISMAIVEMEAEFGW
jgi:hypothetical protein